MLKYNVHPAGVLHGELKVPGDKSISHRALILGAIAEGESFVENFCSGQDCMSTMSALGALGVKCSYDETRLTLSIKGLGMHGLQAPKQSLDLGNSGTGMRLLCGLLAGTGLSVELTGDSSLRTRPMDHIVKALKCMGARVESTDGKPPLKILGEAPLRGMRHQSSVGSAQFKSCLLLAGLYAKGRTEIDTPESRDHTERMLPSFGCPVESHGGVVSLMGGAHLHATSVVVPGDISAAMFVIVGASIAQGSEVVLKGVGINSKRDGGIRILRAMGADISFSKTDTLGEELVADIRVRASQHLKGIEIPHEWVVDAIDEFPALFIAAACARGTTHARGISQLRVKESDRISAMAKGLRTLGVQVEETQDSLSIQGQEGLLQGGEVHSDGDHRVAMAFAISALAARSEVVVHDCANVSTSWPSFPEQLKALGMDISTSNY